MDQKRIIAILGYIIPILFFLPLVTDLKNDPFARFHANQQILCLLVFWVGGIIIGRLGLFALLLSPLWSIAGLVFMILGIINVVHNEMKPLPIFGEYKLLK
jgi:uncharacterized membrane protein